MLMEKNVPGYCTELVEACRVLKVNLKDLLKVSNVRDVLKKVVTKLQGDDLLRKMVLSSKMDKVLLSGFEFDGICKRYLCDLDFNDARVIFLVRYRMLPTKSNFPGRWNGTLCNVCGFEDTGEHVFSCPGYMDLINHKLQYNMFWDKEVLKDMDILRELSRNMKLIIERMEEIQKIC